MRGIIILDEDNDEEREEAEEDAIIDDEDDKKEQEKGREVTFKYEHLPDFCYICGVIGHNDRDCPSKQKWDTKQEYGPWLKANTWRVSPSEEDKNRGSLDRGGFWRSSSGGSKGSNSDSWRKISPENDGSAGSHGGGKEITSPLKKQTGEDKINTSGRRVLIEEGNKRKESSKEADPQEKSMDAKNDQLGPTSLDSGAVKEHKKMGGNGLVMEETTTKEPSSHVPTVQPKEGLTNNGDKSPETNEEKEVAVEGAEVLEKEKNGKQGTFKRRVRSTGGKSKPAEGKCTNKRGADAMEIDMGLEFAKKTKMEINVSNDAKEAVDQRTATQQSNVEAGLQGQPGGPQ